MATAALSDSETTTILVVDDEILIRVPIVQYLRDCGYKIIEAASAEEAMAVLSDRRAKVDVLFSAIEMRGSLDGFSLAKWVREHRPGLEVMLTGTVPRTVNAAKTLCESGPIPKPYGAEVVYSHIRRLLAGRPKI
jgi:DNA-binding NtrC family response regulator